jgi:hypothetical protein
MKQDMAATALIGWRKKVRKYGIKEMRERMRKLALKKHGKLPTT